MREVALMTEVTGLSVEEGQLMADTELLEVVRELIDEFQTALSSDARHQRSKRNKLRGAPTNGAGDCVTEQ